MPSGKYERGLNQRLATSASIKAVWARRNKREKALIANKISVSRRKSGQMVKR